MSWNLGQLNEPAIVFLWHSKMARLRNEYAKLSTIFIGGDDKKLILALHFNCYYVLQIIRVKLP